MVLLDATYKTTKYALPLFFLVVQTNVNFQVAAVIVLQEESTEMIVKALEIVKKWNPEVSPKYAFVDFDEREITALEVIFCDIKVFLCDFHREQAWHRWILKTDNGVSNLCEIIKIGLRRIAHSSTPKDCQSAISDFMKLDHFNGKLRNWFTKTWLPQVKRWSTAFRPADLILCNTNNGTERLNEDLKYDELDGYKNCSLSELLSVLIHSFLPKHYQKYVEMNVRYSGCFKKYSVGVPSYLQNRPKKIVDHLLQKKERVTQAMIDSVRIINEKTFNITGEEDGTNVEKEYQVFMGDDKNFCHCTCKDYRRHRMLCKHFFAIFASRKAKFDDLTSLFRNHPLLVLDESIYVQQEGYEENQHHDDFKPDEMASEEKPIYGLLKKNDQWPTF